MGLTSIYAIIGVGYGILSEGETYLTPLTTIKGKAWTGNPIGVLETSSGYELILETVGRKGTSYSKVLVSGDGVVAKKSVLIKTIELESFEELFNVALNKDGQIFHLVPLICNLLGNIKNLFFYRHIF